MLRERERERRGREREKEGEVGENRLKTLGMLRFLDD